MKDNSLIKKSKDKVKKNFIIEIPRYVVTISTKKKMIEDYDKETSHLNSQPYNIFRVDIFFLGETKLFIYLVSFNFNTQYI